MTDIPTIVGWILVTLGVTSFAGVLGKKYGVNYIIAISAGLIVIVNAMNAKFVEFGPFIVPGGTLLFATTFLVTDIISEKFGKKYAQQAVWAGFYTLIIFFVTVWIVLSWETASIAEETGQAFAQVFSLTPRILIGSMTAYLLGQHHDVWAFHFWKKVTKGKHLWLRNNASTMTSQLIDSVVFAVIAFAGVVPNLFTIIFSLYIIKILIALVDTPFLYGISYVMDRVERDKD